MTTETIDLEAPKKARTKAGADVRTLIRGILWLQIFLALILFSADLSRILPDLFSRTAAPALTNPVAPGDQTRRFRPGDLAPREAPPGSRPLPAPTDMPSRLLFEATTWEDGPALVLTGAIAPGDAERFSDFMIARDAPALVFLNSPGGSVGDALSIGRALRELGAGTRMTEADICLSACPYLLAAGTTRQVADGAMVGVHQHFFGENTALPAFLAVEDIQRGQGQVMEYLVEMGIDPRIMQPALMTPPDEIYVLTPSEMADFALVTDQKDSEEGDG